MSVQAAKKVHIVAEEVRAATNKCDTRAKGWLNRSGIGCGGGAELKCLFVLGGTKHGADATDGTTIPRPS